MVPLVSNCGSPARSSTQDTLIYCSFAATHHGGLGKDYCELIADPDTTPKVVVRMNLRNDLAPGEHTGDFKVSAAVVQDLQKQLEEGKVAELDGYNHDEQMMGGTSYRIHIEYASGKKVTASWVGHNIKPEAWAAYSLIEKFFQPWIKKCY